MEYPILESFSFLFVLFSLNIWSVLLLIFIIILLALFLPLKGSFKLSQEKPNTRFDERDTMFSRREIMEKPDLKSLYYRNNPEKLELDKLWHNKPGLGSEKTVSLIHLLLLLPMPVLLLLSICALMLMVK